jgi:nitroimidazol reductase NimA-like FMN-containing flavoprotein (pyridoxamine 5'-phosphate oxidase superfamily)
MSDELTTVARAIIAANRYMTLATADAGGRPWASPVYYAAPSPVEFLWVSAPGATHSQNVAARPEVGVVIFDSTAPIGTAQAVYAAAAAEQVGDADLDAAVAAYSRISQAHGARAWSRADVSGPAPLRLYRARARETSVLDPEVRGIDARTVVALA